MGAIQSLMDINANTDSKVKGMLKLTHICKTCISPFPHSNSQYLAHGLMHQRAGRQEARILVLTCHQSFVGLDRIYLLRSYFSTCHLRPHLLESFLSKSTKEPETTLKRNESFPFTHQIPISKQLSSSKAYH